MTDDLDKRMAALREALYASDREAADAHLRQMLRLYGSGRQCSVRPPSEPGYYRAWTDLRSAWVVAHVTSKGGALWAEWLGTQRPLAGDDRWRAWDPEPIAMPINPPF